MRFSVDDYTVLAGTQGLFGHEKHDRLLKVADALNLPVVLFGEGGGGRPGDVDAQLVSSRNSLYHPFPM